MVAQVVTNTLDVIEEIAREIATASKAYGSHFRQIAKVLPGDVLDLYAWLASLDDAAIVELAKRLEAVEGRPRPHFTAAVKRARTLALQRQTLAGMPVAFAEALRWAMERAGLSLRALAREVGVGRTTLRQWIGGKRVPSSLQAVERLEAALHLPPGSLARRLPRFGQQRLGVRIKTHREFTRTFLRVASLVRYEVPWADLPPPEREALLREEEERWRRLSHRQIRTRQAQKQKFALPFRDWPPQAQAEWREYVAYASTRLGTGERARRALSGRPLSPRVLRPPTVEKELVQMERFYGYCVRVRGLNPDQLGLNLLTDLSLVRDYLEWRLGRYGDAVPGLTRTAMNFIALVKKLYRRYLPVIGLQGDLEGLRELEKRLKAAGLDETEGYHAVEPLLETPDPLGWLAVGIALMLRDLSGRVGDLLAPKVPARGKAALDALALYRDAILFWTATAHPLRAKHWYAARLDMDQFRQEGDFAPGRGHVGRRGGTYYLAYRVEEFKNASSMVFRNLRADDLVEFPLGDPEHPLAALEVEGTRYALNEVFHVYLQEVLPRLAESLGRSGPLLPLFPGLDSLNRLSIAFRSRSAYVAALPDAPLILPFGPHSLRHIVATSIVKTTGSFEAAANVLLDSVEMVVRHYARFAPRDRYRHGWRLYVQTRGGGR
ncbi:hypothetical protein TthHB5002_c23160 (plasmid) [Thermus thermophilus]|uniref:helix-turn-helix domain-containing protein n=1 Tax=Thermus thermophilus TaxID=274 RepID=UPI00192D162A|nr:helix-turn-helix transcriptional regulator [Thermus thermophilus]BCP99213.1 hypothetical protein TthHB5002_c23160 [Thermus thermophilus]